MRSNKAPLLFRSLDDWMLIAARLNEIAQQVTGMTLRCLAAAKRRSWVASIALALVLSPGAVCAAAEPPVVSIAPCKANPAAACAMAPDAVGAPREIMLYETAVKQVDAGAMGSFPIAGKPHELAYVYAAATSGAAWIFVIDLTAGARIAWVAAPAGYSVESAYFDYIRSPGGQRRPFIAPGAHYLAPTPNPNGAFEAPPWNFLCIFDPDAIAHPDPACGTGFKAYSTSFTTPEGQTDIEASRFRHGGGWVEDVDGDGWDDINLPFLKYILTISGKTGSQLALAHFDVAAGSEPQSPPYFHSGRFYGRFVAFTEPETGRHDILFTDGEGAGFFGGLYCGVSRYVAVAQWQPGPSLQLKWSDYLSFAKTIFKPPYGSVEEVARRGDDLNRCPHFADTGLEWLDRRPLVMFSLFTADDPSAVCQEELLAEQRSNFATTDSAAYEQRCAPAKVPAKTGRWSIQILDALTGKRLAAVPDSYLWGAAPDIISGKPRTFLVQQFAANGGHIAYNHTGEALESLAIMQLADGPSLQPLATLAGPLPAPAVTGVLEYGTFGNMGGGPAYPPGLGSAYEGVSRLVLQDIDGDGLGDIRLTNGKWLGYSAATGRLVIKDETSGGRPQPPKAQ